MIKNNIISTKFFISILCPTRGIKLNVVNYKGVKIFIIDNKFSLDIKIPLQVAYGVVPLDIKIVIRANNPEEIGVLND